MKKVLAWIDRHWIITSLLAAFLILSFAVSDMIMAVLLFGLVINLLLAYWIYKLLRRKLAWPNRHPKKAFALAFVLVVMLGNLLNNIFWPEDYQAFENAVMLELGLD